ncbi:MAG: proteasome-associated ATPase [Nitrospirales bacterium]|nr:MAG: proteasome-associated ATPase [Nitrospirales bacterium]
MSDRDPRADSQPRPRSSTHQAGSSRVSAQPSPLALLDECLASMPEGDHRIAVLGKLKQLMLQQGVEQQQREMEVNKLNTVVEKLTAPANRIGTLVDLPEDDMARIIVGGSEFYANIDPRLERADLLIGSQVLVNEAYVVIRSLGYDVNGPILKVREVLADGRLRMDQEPGRPGILLQRAAELRDTEFKPGDEVRVDPTLRLVIERLEKSHTEGHVLDEVPSVTWEHIGGQKKAIAAIRRAIEYPLLHRQTFQQYQFTQPKGFLLHGPPGCGKTLIGQATAASLAQLVKAKAEAMTGDQFHGSGRNSFPPIERGSFLHVKGPEVLNMWVGESERIVRDLFAQARERRQSGFLPFIFIDEAESILGTRRAVRSYNVASTLVPMFCAELDGIESLHDVVVILATNRPDLIDPAVLRSGRIDRKVKISRPNREAATEILQIYLSPEIPLHADVLQASDGNCELARQTMITALLDRVFARTEENRVLAIRLRNGRRDILYRSDLLSGAVLASIVRRAKEKAVEREIEGKDTGMSDEDLSHAVHEEFREGEIFPPDDSAEEWLKLLDHHPDQVIGVSSFRGESSTIERAIHTII